jgi:putative ribosome biogenesis GTPase RsgA
MTNEAFFQREFVKVAATHWVEYAQKKKKLRRLFQGTPAEDLLMNKLERIECNRSPGVSEALKRFLKSIRERMVARLVLARSLAFYRSHIPVFKNLQSSLESQPLKLYFLESQSYFIEKLFLYSKKLFFNRKDFDILDNFDRLVVKSKRTYYIYRRRQKEPAESVLMDMVRNSMGLIVG